MIFKIDEFDEQATYTEEEKHFQCDYRSTNNMMNKIIDPDEEKTLLASKKISVLEV